jgi:hypothetical protein
MPIPSKRWGNDEQFAAVGDGQAGAVDGLVGDPRGAELVGVHVSHDLGRRLVDGRHVLRLRGAGGVEVGLQVVAHIDAGVAQLALVVVGHHDLEVDVGQVGEEVLLGVVEAGTGGVRR